MSRPRALLLHAFPLDCRMWAETKPVLEAAGHPVSAPDLPGADAEPSLAAWADHVLAAAEGPLVPVGASMGGYLAFELWRRSRDRIAGLALVSTRAGAETPESRRGREATIELLERAGVPGLWAELAPRLFAAGTPGDIVEGARAIALEQGVARLVTAVEAIRDRADSTPLLPEIDVPALVVAGEEDAIVPPAEAEATAAALPDAELVLLPEAGHLAPLERPAELNRALLALLDRAGR